MNNKRINIIFITEIALIGLVILGFIPREIVFYWTIVLAFYVLLVPLEEAIIFFVRSIPLFIAIPLTINFDSLNMWRILSILIFLKWSVCKETTSFFISLFKIFLKQPLQFMKDHPILITLKLLIILALASTFVAPDKILAVKRIVYFLNLSLIGIVIYYYSLTRREFIKKLIRNISIPVIIVTLVGFLQLISTYFMDIYQFVDFWTLVAEKNLFGNQWAAISREANTWFAYFGDQLSLRMFSLFPDSHSFPIFLLLGLPSIFAISILKIVDKNNNLRAMWKSRGSILVLFIPLIFLAAILSGTRGIWAASAGVLLIVFWLVIWFKKQGIDSKHRVTFKYTAYYLSLFFLLFSVAYPIIASPQFLVSKGNSLLLQNRLRSVLDFGETSNKERIRIWKLSAQSIIKHPLVGVGIGNFPVVLKQDLSLARAGSSAHNLYLHIAAEMGITALVLSLIFLYLLMKKVYINFIDSVNSLEMIYFSAMLIFLPWVLIYSLTDPAIFDERAFLLFTVVCSIIFSNKKPDLSG